MNACVFIFKKQQNTRDLQDKYEICIPDGFRHINHGTTVVQAKVMEEMVLVMKFVPFEKMTKDELMSTSS